VRQLRKKNKSDGEGSREVLLRIANLEAEVKKLTQPKPPEDWMQIRTVTRVIDSPKEPPRAPAPLLTCSVCRRQFRADADMAQRFSPWAELIGPNGKPLKNYAKDGYLYHSCSLECSNVISQSIDRLATGNNMIKVNLGELR
jgi:hypothetical protein